MSTRSTAPSPPLFVEARRFRDTLARYPSGITVISSMDETEPVGFTCQAFYSVSLEPPLVSFSVMRTSTSYPRVRDSGHFAVNLLAEDQRHVSDQFARTGTDKWHGISWVKTPSGLPALTGTLGWIDCEIWDEHVAGDHFIVIGEVRALGSDDQARTDPLIFFDRAYRRLEHDDGPQ
ncbi:flavin reductase family protein [Nesterenkonia flava]|uniref:Flavin reductase family protein n=1 Tax=Nesterenkonia flava TaxID=469799 RepID=A0ABU1FPH3_9MICC|nr:flavin reductase family protein [Nesterenkonia flava]MDR5710544.1 flavin reductase family protein [Nesterenkonia flava]